MIKYERFYISRWWTAAILKNHCLAITPQPIAWFQLNFTWGKQFSTKFQQWDRHPWFTKHLFVFLMQFGLRQWRLSYRLRYTCSLYTLKLIDCYTSPRCSYCCMYVLSIHLTHISTMSHKHAASVYNTLHSVHRDYAMTTVIRIQWRQRQITYSIKIYLLKRLWKKDNYLLSALIQHNTVIESTGPFK